MEPLADSVMCVFPLKEIRRTFTENIQDCFRGVGNTGPAHISVPYGCINTVRLSPLPVVHLSVRVASVVGAHFDGVNLAQGGNGMMRVGWVENWLWSWCLAVLCVMPKCRCGHPSGVWGVPGGPLRKKPVCQEQASLATEWREAVSSLSNETCEDLMKNEFHNDRLCFQDFAIEDDYCGAYELNNPIAGTKPISANAVIRFDGTLVSSIAVTHTHDYTVAFVGTAEGTIKKVGEPLWCSELWFVHINVNFETFD